MKKVIILLLICYNFSFSNEYSLNDLLRSAIISSKYSTMDKNYTKISNEEISVLISNYYPQFNIDAQATYQSDIFDIPIRFPGINIPTLRQDQYNISLNISQVIWDGGTISKSTELSEISSIANSDNARAKLRNVIEIISNLYYSGRKIEATITSVKSMLNTLESNKSQIISLVENGILVRSNLDAIEIQIQSRKLNLESLEQDYLNILNNLMNYCEIKSITGLKQFEIDESLINSTKIIRSEIDALDKIQELNVIKSELSNTENMPKFLAFAKLGIGNPNQFNMFEQEWSEFYIIGLKMSWKPFSWFSESKNSEIAEYQNINLKAEQTEIIRQINSQVINERNEFSKIKSLLILDKNILELQQRIIKDKYKQFISGTATVNEYISELNSLQQYEINMHIHNIMLENAKSNILIKSGNYQGVLQ